MAGEEGVCCVALVVLLVIVIVLYILIKFAKLFAYVGAWRTGKALKKISYEGLVIKQPGQLQQPVYAQPPYQSICPYCGAIGYAGQLRCSSCGRTLLQAKVNESAQPPAQVKANGTKFCRHCGEKIVADSTYCEHCGKRP